MSDANLASIAFKKTSLVSNLFKLLRYTGEDFKNTKETAQSQEIRSDGQIPDLVLVGSQPDGGFNFELSYFEAQPFLEGALRNEWQTINVVISSTLTTSSQTATAAAGTFLNVPKGCAVKITGATNPANNGIKRVIGKNPDGSTLVFAPGSIAADQGAIVLTYAGKSLVNGQMKIPFDFEKRIVNGQGQDFYLRYLGMLLDTFELNIESKKIVTGSAKFIGLNNEISDSGQDAGAIDPAAATGTLTLTGNAIAAETLTIGGVVYTFVASADDLGEVTIGGSASVTIDNLIAEINGNGLSEAHPTVTAAPGAGDTMVVTAIDEGTAGNAIATTEVMTNATWGAVTLTGGADQATGYDETTTGDIMNGASNMGSILVDGAVATDRFKSIKLTFGNGVRGKDALGVIGNFDTGLGTFSVTGSLMAYFLNNLLPTKIKAHTSFGLSFSLKDAAGNELHFYMPATKPAQGDPAITAINTDVMIDTSFQSIMDRANTGKTMFIDAFDAA